MALLPLYRLPTLPQHTFFCHILVTYLSSPLRCSYGRENVSTNASRPSSVLSKALLLTKWRAAAPLWSVTAMHTTDWSRKTVQVLNVRVFGAHCKPADIALTSSVARASLGQGSACGLWQCRKVYQRLDCPRGCELVMDVSLQVCDSALRFRLATCNAVCCEGTLGTTMASTHGGAAAKRVPFCAGAACSGLQSVRAC